MGLQRIRYRKNEAQEFRALTERLVGESGLDIELPYESPGVQHLMKYFYVLVGILVRLRLDSWRLFSMSTVGNLRTL